MTHLTPSELKYVTPENPFGFMSFREFMALPDDETPAPKPMNAEEATAVDEPEAIRGI